MYSIIIYTVIFLQINNLLMGSKNYLLFCEFFSENHTKIIFLQHYNRAGSFLLNAIHFIVYQYTCNRWLISLFA